MTQEQNLAQRLYDVLVIGGGPGGITAATEAAGLGASVALIEAERVGGRANWHSLLPSKVWLTAADRLGRRARDAVLGLSPAGGSVEASVVTSRIAELSQTNGQSYREALAALGVHLLEGKAAFDKDRTVQLGNQLLTAEQIVVATGSGPIFFPSLKPDGKRMIAPRHMSHLTTVPESIVVVGGGVTGAEFVYLFDRLGSRVTWLVDQYGVLPRSDRDVVAELVAALTARGVELVEGVATHAMASDGEQVSATLQDGRSFVADYGFIAIGRRADTQGLNMGEAGIAKATNGAILTDGFQQSSVPGVYAVGDVAGPPMTANKAMAQARVAAHHALGQSVAAYRADTVVEAVYTDPQLAQVGLTEERAQEVGQPFEVDRITYAGILKAQLAGESEGVLKLLVEPESGRLLGGAAVGAHASDLMTPLAVALGKEAGREDLALIYAGYPTLSELPLEAARVARS